MDGRTVDGGCYPALQPTVQRVKCVGRKRRRLLVLVVQLVNGGVQQAVVQRAVDPVHARVGEDHEQRGGPHEEVEPPAGGGGEVLLRSGRKEAEEEAGRSADSR